MSARNRPGALRGWLVAALASALGACMLGPDFVRPPPPGIHRYTNDTQTDATVAASGLAQRFVVGGEVPADWWTLFGSGSLDALMQDAFAGNPGLQSAQASLRASQDNLRAGYGVFFPQVDAQVGATRERGSQYRQGPAGIFNLFTASVSIGYALDVFGGERRQTEALAAQVDYERASLRAAYLTLSANLVNTLIARAAYAEQIAATNQLIELQVEQLAIATVQAQAGTSAYSAVLSLRSQLAATRASLPSLEQKIDQANHLLATLVGQLPAQRKVPDLSLADLTLPADLPLSVPSELVRRRPDVLAAEAQWHAASANIGVATAAMFPGFSLAGSYGASNTKFGHLSDADSKFWSVGPSVDLPLFNGGSLWFKRKAAVNVYEAAAADYRGIVLSAFAQVADTLRALQHDAQALDAQSEALTTARQALALLQANYQAGLVGYLPVLSADAQLHQAQINEIQAAAQRFQDTTALFVALGGGWNANAGLARTPPDLPAP